ncbi:MAG: hypothetical protein JW776_06440 [Candidatus Lokiarchaeota archaeon]|nr:hypothetical protein [Candidatus Lokiarchaeota archaeon]
MATFQEVFFAIINWFPRNAGWMLIIGGVMAITWMGYETKRKQAFFKKRFKKEDWEEVEVSKFLKVLSFAGLALGILFIWAAAVGAINNIPPSTQYATKFGDKWDWLTTISLLVVGIVMFLKPINDLPWSGMIGLLAGVATAVLLVVFIPKTWLANPNAKWVILGIGFVISTLVGVSMKFWVGTLQSISRVLSYPPIALVVALYCFVQGGLILLWGFGLGNLGAI